MHQGISCKKEILTNKYQLVIFDSDKDLTEKAVNEMRMFLDAGFNARIILLTESTDMENEIKACEAGISIYHKKPINQKLLIAQIKSVLSQDIPCEDIQLRDILIKPQERRLCRNNREVVLTPTEYDFLLLLIKENGKVLTRNQIIRKVMNYNHDVTPCAVDTMVSRVRKKLGREEKPVIETVHSTGYRLSSFYATKNRRF